MQPPDLEIGDDQPLVLQRVRGFRQGRAIAAGENVFGDEICRCPARPRAPDEVNERHPAGFEHFAHMAKILAVMGDADMLEHPHRHDPVKGLMHVAVIGEANVDLVLQPGLAHPLSGQRMLFRRQGHAHDIDAVIARQSDRHAAPATADVEHAHTRFEQKFLCNMAFLGLLRLIQSHVGMLEIGAAILPIRVQKQVIQFTRQVIVMRHIGARLVDRVELRETPPEKPSRLARFLEPGHPRAGLVTDRQRQKPAQIIALDDVIAIHIALTDPQIGLEDDLPYDIGRGDRELDGDAGAVAIAAQFAIVIGQFQRTYADQMA